MKIDKAYHWLRSVTRLDPDYDPDIDIDDDDPLDDLIDELTDEADDDDLDGDPDDTPDDDDFDVPRDDLEDADETPDDEDDPDDDDDDDDGWADRDHLVADTAFESRGDVTSAGPATSTALVAFLVNDADRIEDAAGAAAFLTQLCGEGSIPYPTTVIASDRGSNAGRFVASALGLRLQTLSTLRAYDPHTETADQFDDRTRDAIEDIQAVGGLPVIVGSASTTAFLANVDVDDPRDEHAFSLLSSGGVLAITTRGLVLLHRPNPATCIDCAHVDLPCPFHDADDD